MSNDKCHRCGSDASLRAAGQDSVFRPICQECFENHHSEHKNPPDWRDVALLSSVIVVGFGIDKVGGFNTVDSIGVVMFGFTIWLALTTVSGEYPWSMPRMGRFK